MKDLMEKLNDSTTLPIYKIYEATNKLEVEKLEAFVDYCRDSVKHLPHIQPIGQNPTDTAHVQNANVADKISYKYFEFEIEVEDNAAIGLAIKEGNYTSALFGKKLNKGDFIGRLLTIETNGRKYRCVNAGFNYLNRDEIRELVKKQGR